MFDFPQWQREKWFDPEENPIIGYDETPEAGYAIGDPQILVPGEYDNQWHCFYHGFYKDGQPFFHHQVSDDGFKWTLKKKWPWRSNPCFMFHEGDEWYLYFTEITDEQKYARYQANNVISVRRTKDFETWTEPETVLAPELDWEREYMQVNYTSIEARNPCVIKLPNGRYRLYYSAGTVMLDKCGYEEPKYISFAESDTPMGPFVKYGRPILAPDQSIWYRNFGAGAIKVFGLEDGYLGLYNSIYNDKDGYHHSAINLIRSDDGIEWTEAPFNPILPPAGGGWKGEFVYQLDLVRAGNDLRIYYNGRDKWRDGIECIGVSILKNDATPVKKLWDLSGK